MIYQSFILFFLQNSLRDSNKNNSTVIKKSSNGLNLEETGQSQIKLMPILESGENDDKLVDQQLSTRLNKNLTLTTTTLDWTPNEYLEKSILRRSLIFFS